jgi:hypothetical protein
MQSTVGTSGLTSMEQEDRDGTSGQPHGPGHGPTGVIESHPSNIQVSKSITKKTWLPLRPDLVARPDFVIPAGHVGV